MVIKIRLRQGKKTPNDKIIEEILLLQPTDADFAKAISMRMRCEEILKIEMTSPSYEKGGEYPLYEILLCLAKDGWEEEIDKAYAMWFKKVRSSF